MKMRKIASSSKISVTEQGLSTLQLFAQEIRDTTYSRKNSDEQGTAGEAFGSLTRRTKNKILKQGAKTNNDFDLSATGLNRDLPQITKESSSFSQLSSKIIAKKIMGKENSERDPLGSGPSPIGSKTKIEIDSTIKNKPQATKKQSLLSKNINFTKEDIERMRKEKNRFRLLKHQAAFEATNSSIKRLAIAKLEKLADVSNFASEVTSLEKDLVFFRRNLIEARTPKYTFKLRALHNRFKEESEKKGVVSGSGVLNTTRSSTNNKFRLTSSSRDHSIGRSPQFCRLLTE